MAQPYAVSEMAPAIPARVLLVSDSDAFARALRETLLEAGCREVRIVRPGEAYSADGYDRVVSLSGGPAPRVTPPLRRLKQPRSEGTRYAAPDIIGESPALKVAEEQMSRVAVLEAAVLLQGETGTGKELFAQAIHNLSPRAGKPFVAVNLAAVPEALLESELFGYEAGSFTGASKGGHKGRFLQAEGGTIFLDEIGDLPLHLQAKLLRVLQEREIQLVGGGRPVPLDVRVISASHRDLTDLVAQGRFREDLYYRLNVLTLTLPPLRERTGDVLTLARHCLARLAERYDRPVPVLSPEAEGALLRHRWPGNVRELQNAMEHALAYAGDGEILVEHLPAALQRPARPAPPQAVAFGVDPVGRSERGVTRARLLEALRASGGNKALAARELNISRAGLYIKLKEYQIFA
jgi:transcriptional regulator with PAS, ATPase and Fis domain